MLLLYILVYTRYKKKQPPQRVELIPELKLRGSEAKHSVIKADRD